MRDQNAAIKFQKLNAKARKLQNWTKLDRIFI